MEKISDNDAEQLQMLLMVLEDVKDGICLFQSEEQARWVERIRKEEKSRKLIVHNIADDEEAAGMPTISDFERWLSQSDADVVIVYNLQLLGIRFGDDEAVEKLNAMRDQIQNLGKLFLLGASPYFGLLLSRNARDLYSCIRYHFRLSGVSAEMGKRDREHGRIPGGDDALAMEKYWEYKKRAQSLDTTDKMLPCLACMETWLAIRESLPLQEKDAVRKMAVFSDDCYRQREIDVSDAEPVWILAWIWMELGEKGKAFYWYQLIADKIRKELGESHKLYADALVNFSNYYEKTCDFEQCERNYDAAICIYKREDAALDEYYKVALNRLAVLYRRKYRFSDALAIYDGLLRYDTRKYGSGYEGNALYWNNIGRVYEELSDFSKALIQYREALDLVTVSGKRNSLSVVLYNNISSVYLKCEDTKNAWKYIRLAKREAEQLYGDESPYLIGIYNMMSGIWGKRGQAEREWEYLERALDQIRRTRSEETEEAAFVYCNAGNFLFRNNELIRAVSFYQMSLKIRIRIYEKTNEYTAGTYEGLAAAFRQLSDMKSYKENLDRANEIHALLAERRRDASRKH